MTKLRALQNHNTRKQKQPVRRIHYGLLRKPAFDILKENETILQTIQKHAMQIYADEHQHRHGLQLINTTI